MAAVGPCAGRVAEIRPCAWRALGIDRQALRLCSGGAPVFKIFELLGRSGRPAGPGWPGRPARACTGLLRPLGWWPAGAGCKRTCDRQ